MQTLLSGSNVPRPRPRARDTGPMTLDPRLWPQNIWWRYYCLSMENLFFGVIKQFLAKIWLLSTFWLVSKEFFGQLWSDIFWLISFMYLHRLCTCFNFLQLYKVYHLRKWLLICTFTWTKRFLVLAWITWIWSHYTLSNPRFSDTQELKKELEVNYQRASESGEK